MRCLLGAYVERMGGAILGYARMLDTSYRRSHKRGRHGARRVPGSHDTCTGMYHDTCTVQVCVFNTRRARAVLRRGGAGGDRSHVGWPCVGVWWPGCVRWVARAPCPVFCNHIAAWLYTPRIHGEKPRRRAGPRAAQHEHGRRRNKRKFRRQGRLWSLDVDESMHAR